MTVSKKYLFVCGVGRSGTTALGCLLNLHPEIVLGIERYKYRFAGSNRQGVDFGSLFAKQRFFQEDPDDSNNKIFSGKHKSIYEAAYEKFDDAIYVGDKIPGLYRHLSFLKMHYPAAKIIYILRDPAYVASSWQGRADKGGSWPKENGYEAAIEEWNRSVATMCGAQETYREDLIFLSYERLFGRNAFGIFSEMLKRLALDPKRTSAIERFLQRSAKTVEGRDPVDSAISNHVRTHADYFTYSLLMQHVL